MNSLGKILEGDSDKHNFRSECFTGNAYEQYMTAFTNTQGEKYYITKEEIDTGMDAINNFISPPKNTLNEWFHLLGVAHNTEGMLVR